MISETPTATGFCSWPVERERLEAELGDRITLDALTGPERGGVVAPVADDAGHAAGWLIAQRKRGHRHSIDDVLTAWYALQVSPPGARHLDLGTGVGTVGLLTLWGMGPEARLTCIEAQQGSFRLLATNVEGNGLGGRVERLFGDLRELSLDRDFPLITGSPPYFPEGTGVVPEDSQKAHARFELRGDIGDYAAAAVRHLAPDGWVVLCFPSRRRDYGVRAITAAGLDIVRQRDVIPRETLEPLFTLFACRHRRDDAPAAEIERPLTVRWVDGALTPEMRSVRRVFGFGKDGEA